MNDSRKQDQASTDQAEQAAADRQQKSESVDSSTVESQLSAACSSELSLDRSEQAPAVVTPNSGTVGRSMWLTTFVIAVLALLLVTQPYWPWPSPGFLSQDEAHHALTELQTELNRLERTQSSIRRDLQAELETQQSVLLNLERAMDQDALLEALETRIQSELDSEADRTDNRLAELEGHQNSQQEALVTQLEALEERVQHQIEQLALRVDSVGENLQDTDRSLVERLALIQVDALLAMGLDRLELNHDVAAAIMAWQRASDRLQSLESSVFDPLRASIELEQTLLIEYRANDIDLTQDQRFNQLNQLAVTTADWPAVEVDSSVAIATDHDEQLGWGERVGQALGSLVRIEKVEQAVPSVLEVEQARNRIRQSLITAALAGARLDWALNQALIEAAEADIRRVYDFEDPSVQRGLEQLEMLKQEPEQTDLPELGASRQQIMRLLEQSR